MKTVSTSASEKLTYTICTPWQLPDACSRTVNRYCLYSTINSNDNNKEEEDIMRSKEFNHRQPSRHIALQSNDILTVGHDELFKALKPFEIRCIYPYVTAGITIISFYKLSEAEKSIEIIQSQFNHLYNTCYVKPCLINKNLNEQIFVTIRYGPKALETKEETAEYNYLTRLSLLDSIYSLSEATISSELRVANIEFDDERTSAKVLQDYHDIVIEKDIRLQSFEATNNEFMCTCLKKKDLRWNQQDTLPTCFLNSSFIEMDNGGISSDNMNKIKYSKDHENHSFFSVDPFSLKPATIVSSDVNTDDMSNSSISSDIELLSSSSSSSTISDRSSWKGTKRESYDSSMLTSTTCSTKGHDDENSEYTTPLSHSPTTTTGSLTDSSTTQTVVLSKKSTHNWKKTKDEKSNQFNLENIISGKDTRTTFMIRNIPNKYTQQMLMDCINETHANTYDFLYLRIDFKNKCNVGYAFINFINVESVISFYKDRDGKKWKLFNSDKKCALSYANIQGKEALIRKFKNSQVMDEDSAYKPKLFYSDGVNKGKEQPFPKPDSNTTTSANASTTSSSSKQHRESKNQRHRYHRPKRC